MYQGQNLLFSHSGLSLYYDIAVILCDIHYFLYHAAGDDVLINKIIRLAGVLDLEAPGPALCHLALAAISLIHFIYFFQLQLQGMDDLRRERRIVLNILIKGIGGDHLAHGLGAEHRLAVIVLERCKIRKAERLDQQYPQRLRSGNVLRYYNHVDRHIPVYLLKDFMV